AGAAWPLARVPLYQLGRGRCRSRRAIYRVNAVADEDLRRLEQSDLSLLETVDHVLNRGLVIAGEITISVADIDLIFVGLNLVVSSVETAHEVLRKRQIE